MAALAPGTVLAGKYRIDAPLGQGGMSTVYRAHHLDLDQVVAVKVLLPEMIASKNVVARFLREARAAAKLKGEHVARVLDVGGLDEAAPYIVMEYLDGSDLSAMIKATGPLVRTTAVDIALQACAAIAEAHSIGIIHRDVKAANIFVTQRPDAPPCAKVLDFGIATTPDAVGELTTTESVFGTPAYMAPEQMRSTRTADERSDIWSLGVVLFELLEGHRPFRDNVYAALVFKVGLEPPEPMVQTPRAMQAIVLRCLEKKPEARFQSVAELAHQLVKFAGDAVRAKQLADECTRLLRRSGANLRSTPALGQPLLVATPTSVTEGAGETTISHPLRRRSRARLAMALAAGALIAGAVAFTQLRTASEPTETPNPAVQPSAEPVSIASTLTAAVEAPPVAPAPVIVKSHAHEVLHPAPAAAPPPPITAADVTAKFMATRRAYLVYREKNGMQLERGWTELATFMQFHPDALDEAARRIDEFRAKLRE